MIESAFRALRALRSYQSGYMFYHNLVFIFYLEHISSLAVGAFLLLLPLSVTSLGEQRLIFGNISFF